MALSLRRIVPDPFIAALVGTVLLASVLPAQGSFATVVSTAATLSIALLFFLHGVRLQREAIVAGFAHWRLHLVILSSTFVLFPLLGLILEAVLHPVLPAPLWLGILYLCALPSTIQSSIAFTSIARGNVAGAVASAAASNIIGIALAPLIVGLIAQAHGRALSPGGVVKIAAELLLPFAVGHLLRPWLGAWAARHKPLLSLTDRGTIVLAVYSAFSAAVIAHIWRLVPPAALLALVAVLILLLAIVLATTRWSARALGFAREDEIAILFCGSKKSLATGLPMAKVLFAAGDIGVVMLPLMLFHQIQLMACAWIARRYAETGAEREDRGF